MSHRELKTCQSGASLLLVALMFPLLLLVVGITVDIGRIYAVQTKAQAASDAALLGAVATRNTTEVNDEIIHLFNANFPTGYMNSTLSPPVVTEVAPGIFNSTFTVTVPTTIMSIFGNNGSTFTILSQVTVDFLNTSAENLELTLVLDNTGSMVEILGPGQPSKLDALKQAATDLVNIVYGAAESLGNVHVSIVPFDVDVNVGPSHAGWVQTASLASYKNYAKTGFGPLGNRNNDYPPNDYNDVSDAPPTTDATRFRVPKSANYTLCVNAPTNTLAQMKFGMGSKSQALKMIQTMEAAGCTRINVGLMWGWFTLSPAWEGVWGRSGLPAPNSPDLSKQMVLMTDGLNTVFVGANGASIDDVTTAELCEAIKAHGITLYTVGFGTGGNGANNINVPLLQNCASRPTYFFLAPSADDLKRAFHEIGDMIVSNSTLRLSQ